MGDNYKEVCWREKVLKEASQLLPSRCVPDDTWEQSQDIADHTILPQSSTDDILTSHNISLESPNNLIINPNPIAQYVQNTTDVCVSSTFQITRTENVEETYNLDESPKRRLDISSNENSPKRMNLGCHSVINYVACKDATETCDQTIHSIESKNHIISVESTSEHNGQIYNLEECQVAPRLIEFPSINTLTNITSETNRFDGSREEISKSDEESSLMNHVGYEKTVFKPRQTSIDSAMDSGIGDSCNSVDSSEEKGEIGESKSNELERYCWPPKIRESLATRLPGIYIYK